jgi:hypothetical protein
MAEIDAVLLATPSILLNGTDISSPKRCGISDSATQSEAMQTDLKPGNRNKRPITN